LHHGGRAGAAAPARHHLEERTGLMAAWHEGPDETTLGVVERLRALVSAWYRSVFRADAPR